MGYTGITAKNMETTVYYLLGFRLWVWGSGFGVLGLGFGFWVEVSGFRV